MKTRSKAAKYKPAGDREQDLRLALLRIQKGRSRSGEKQISIAAVAREAGVSAALIHNHYPVIAETIRGIQGQSSRAARDIKQNYLVAERKKSALYRKEIEELKYKISALASINEVLLGELALLKAITCDRNVIGLNEKTR
ncbi:MULTISPECIES: TetR family transcriptional regulator [Pseudomonas]|uniref:TetR family transcriptional regulator n=1 Tax=Pseudomonas putida TaxID=303 RepID=A0A6I6Y635_PSEPU|nr:MULTISPECIES: TetR family transcriptional regulator [Pseudomonas]MBA6113545.1 TetR family transcriptional regulator [Pseudomonas asiatica]QHG67138.1 TetR family transcriptional regulator [Pseudomonas putida]